MKLGWTDTITLICTCLLAVAVLHRWVHGSERSLICTISSVDGEKYCVRDRERLQDAADLLANTSEKMDKVVEYCAATSGKEERVQRLVDRYTSGAIRETLPTSEYTAYSENKGEKMVFCVNVRRNGERLIDQNTLTFVALHELAHVMTVSIGHTPEFWKNFKFLIMKAVECNVYTPVNYKKTPAEYCSMELTHNPYYS